MKKPTGSRKLVSTVCCLSARNPLVHAEAETREAGRLPDVQQGGLPHEEY